MRSRCTALAVGGVAALVLCVGCLASPTPDSIASLSEPSAVTPSPSNRAEPALDQELERLCSQAPVVSERVGTKDWPAATDALYGAWFERGADRTGRVAEVLPSFGSLEPSDTQTINEVSDLFTGRCAEAELGTPLRQCGGLYDSDSGRPAKATVVAALARRGYSQPVEVAVVGRLTVAVAIAAETADAHARGAFFFLDDRLVATDLDNGSHFDVNLCSVTPESVVTGYPTGVMALGGPDSSCARGMRYVRVRWRVEPHSIEPTAEIPEDC